MRKTIQKPENWQDFEHLCKKLFGEIWGIPMKIKKNGRNGQPQAGVDVYGIPKGELNYWGIQCKGKDDYSNARLTKSEIKIEIKKARTFLPNLDVFIIATTMNKDSEIEEFVRIKDLESRQNGDFEILLYCWEDIADLIDENQDTYNFWVGNKAHRTKFSFDVYLNEFQTEFIIKPTCIRTIKKYKVKEPVIEKPINTNLPPYFDPAFFANNKIPSISFENSIFKENINESICTFQVIMVNTGSAVIEDWHVAFNVTGKHKEIIDFLADGPMGMVDLKKVKHSRIYVENNFIQYVPFENEPLIQKSNRFFEIHIIPECREYIIPIEWKLLARDFDTSGTIYLKVQPTYEDKIVFEYVDNEKELKENVIISIDEKKNYED